MAHGFIELHMPLHQDKVIIHEVGYVYTYGWFTLLYDWNQHYIEEKLSSD